MTGRFRWMVVWMASLLCVASCTPRPEPPKPVRPALDPRLAVALASLERSPPDLPSARRNLQQLQAHADLEVRRVAAAVLTLVNTVSSQQAKRADDEVQLADLRSRLTATERALSQAHSEADGHEDRAERLSEERERLKGQLKQATEQAKSQEAELTALRDKLEALKRIDLGRSP